jgi:hypothetical protein
MVSAILINYESRAIMHEIEEPDMQREEKAQNVSDGMRMSAERLAEHADTRHPLSR